jgi:hypothetical protein
MPPLAGPQWVRENMHDLGVPASARYLFAGMRYSRAIVAHANTNGTFMYSNSNSTSATRARPAWWANGDSSWKKWRRVPFFPYCAGGRALGSSGRGGNLGRDLHAAATLDSTSDGDSDGYLWNEQAT